MANIMTLGSSINCVASSHPVANAKSRVFCHKLPKAIRTALGKTFRYWLKNIAPKHFTIEVFSQYRYEFAVSYKRDYVKEGGS